MIEDWLYSHPGDILGRLLPPLTAIVALFIDLMPLPSASPEAIMPSLLVCVVFYWTISRPDLLGIVWIFVLGMVIDGIGGMPLGLTSLVFLVARNMLMPRERFLSTTSFIVIWASFVVAATAVLGMRWVVACIWYGQLFELRPMVLELALTVAVYPVVSYSLGSIRELLPKANHVSGS
ncbi:MAG: rod shape-determining protein MreD [Geminicoccaceae bacterium]|nr:rod shape-determining protein MreD [Geminicoccaceae bacterium]MCB9942026.1 rod shape-determining protein MreD [Geminicoccaceae bacterium]